MQDLARHRATADADYQAKYFKEHGYYPGKSPKAAAYAAARNGLAKEFGAEAVAAWEAYGKLPKGSKAREDYKAAHPELRAYDMAAYNPTEYAEAKKVFGDNAWMEWAQAPKSGETDEEKALWAEGAARQALRLERRRQERPITIPNDATSR